MTYNDDAPPGGRITFVLGRACPSIVLFVSSLSIFYVFLTLFQQKNEERIYFFGKIKFNTNLESFNGLTNFYVNMYFKNGLVRRSSIFLILWHNDTR